MPTIRHDGRAISVGSLSRVMQQDLAEELAWRAVARAREGKHWKAAINLWRLMLVVFLATGCAPIRPATYTPESCYTLTREARKAGTWQVGASSVALGLGAGGAVLPLVQESKGAQMGLALGAVLFGAVGLAAGYYEDEANRDMLENCPRTASERPDAR